MLATVVLLFFLSFYNIHALQADSISVTQTTISSGVQPNLRSSPVAIVSADLSAFSKFAPSKILVPKGQSSILDETKKLDIVFKQNRKSYSVEIRDRKKPKNAEKNAKTGELKGLHLDVIHSPGMLKLRGNNSYDDPCKKLLAALKLLGKIKDKVIQRNIPLDIVANCLNSHKYDEKIARDTVEALKGFFEFYVFRDISPRMFSFDDLLKPDVPFKTDMEFQEFVYENVKSLYDGHLVYKPACYRYFTYLQPLYLTSLVDENNQTRIYVSSTNGNVTNEIEQLYESEVVLFDFGDLTDDNLCPGGNVQLLADVMDGKYRGARARFNNAITRREFILDSYNCIGGNLLLTRKIPSKPEARYRFLLKNGTLTGDVYLPWVAVPVNGVNFATPGFSDKESFWKNYCLPSISTANEIQKTPPEKSPEKSPEKLQPLWDEYEPVSVNVEYEKSSDPSKPRDKSSYEGDDLFERIYLSKHYSIYGHIATKTAVLHILTFDTYEENDSWMYGLMVGFNRLHGQGYSRLIVDLSENVGGDICLAKNFVQYITRITDPGYKPERPIPGYTIMRYSQKLVDLSIDNYNYSNIFSTSRYLHGNNDIWNFDSAAINFTQHYTTPNNETITREGRVVANLTSNCESYYAKIIRNVKWKITYSDIIVLSNGICGSSCAVVLNALSRKKIKTVAVTSSTMSVDLPMSIQSFAGGEKVNSDTLIEHAKDTNKNIIKPFPIKASLDLAFRAIGLSQEDKSLNLLEFASWPANAELRISNENVLRPKLIWNTAIYQAFKSDFKGYPIFQEPLDRGLWKFDTPPRPPNYKCHTDNVLNFFLTWDGGNFW